ncbi:hypothetical protein ACFLV7_07050 [Chloroflexota bacterium]
MLGPEATGDSIVCLDDRHSAEENCGGCGEYNIVVWEDGFGDWYDPRTYSTVAGNIYCGHNPCVIGDNLVWCGTWDMQNCIPDP